MRSACSNCGRKANKSNLLCSFCRSSAVRQNERQQRLAKRQALLERPCRGCGKPINKLDKRSVYCCRDCGKLGRVVVQCVVCSKDIVRTTSEVERFPTACCSRRCQLSWAARSQKMYTRKAARLPVLVRCDCGELDSQRPCSNCSRWQSLLQTKANQALRRFPQRTWRSVLSVLAKANKNRVGTACQTALRKDGPKKWSTALNEASKHSLMSMSWRQKLSNMAGNQKRRMLRKSMVQTLNDSCVYKGGGAITPEKC